MTSNPLCRFLTKIQVLSGPEVFAQVKQQSRAIVDPLNDNDTLPAPAEWKSMFTDSTNVRKILVAADADGVAVTEGDMVEAEMLIIDGSTTRRDFADQIRWNQSYYRLAQGF